MAENPRLMTYEKLRALIKLDLTDRRLRQLAKEGHFPEPIEGQYDWPATIAGLLAYYRKTQADHATRKQAIDDEKHRALKRDNDLADGLLLAKADVVAEIRKLAEPVKVMLRQKLENEYPLAVAGLDVPQARIYGKRLEDDIMAEFQKLFSKFGV
jgi:hypothetical protein